MRRREAVWVGKKWRRLQRKRAGRSSGSFALDEVVTSGKPAKSIDAAVLNSVSGEIGSKGGINMFGAG